ncbi:MAG: hypothetical protein ACXVJ7_15325 [Acidimicrobiia bacterium]
MGTAERIRSMSRLALAPALTVVVLLAGVAACGSGQASSQASCTSRVPPRPTAAGDMSDMSPEEMAHMSSAVSPRPLAVRRNGLLDPNKIDLGGVPGVTLAEQRRAESLLRRTILALPKWSDVRTAKADGYITLGDAARCWEHYINVKYIMDSDVLDPLHPESLVYKVGPHNTRILQAAMYELAPHTTLANAPDLGGKLTQWHVHNTLCFKPGSFQGVGQLPDGTCPPPFRKPSDVVPMIHVWIVPKECGPFAMLDDMLGGEVAQGSSVACDRTHGSTK